MKKFDLQCFVLRILAIMDDEPLSHHEPTGLEPDDETPASPRGSFHGDFTLEDGELTVASQDQSALQETCLSLNGFLPNFHPTASQPKATLPCKSAEHCSTKLQIRNL